MKDKNNLILAIKGVCVFLIYMVKDYIQIFLLQLFNININNMSLGFKTLYLTVLEIIMFLFFVYLFKDYFKKCYYDLKNNFKAYSKKYIDYWALALGLMMLSNLIIVSIFPSSSPSNQEAIVEIFKKAPVYMFFSAVIMAPLVEETVFRLSFRKIIKSDVLFIILSGLVFGSLHVIGSFETLSELLYLIPYSIPGWVYAYVLVKSDNIFIPIGLHFLHNGLLMLLQVLLLFL